MQIVIDVDDNLYTRLFDNGIDNYEDAEDMATAIRKGTPLPHKTGRWIVLKDEYGNVKDTVCSCCNASGNHKYKFCPNCNAEMVALAIEQKRRWDKRRSS